jgi:hypothetical protein
VGSWGRENLSPSSEREQPLAGRLAHRDVRAPAHTDVFTAVPDKGCSRSLDGAAALAGQSLMVAER